MYHGSTQAVALRYESMPFDLDISKAELTSRIKASKGEYGVTNTPIYFTGGRKKATVIYLSAFDETCRRELLISKHMHAIHVACISMYRNLRCILYMHIKCMKKN